MAVILVVDVERKYIVTVTVAAEEELHIDHSNIIRPDYTKLARGDQAGQAFQYSTIINY